MSIKKINISVFFLYPGGGLKLEIQYGMFIVLGVVKNDDPLTLEILCRKFNILTSP